MSDEDCPHSKDDKGHCVHWCDGEECCWCKAPAMTEEQKKEQGMV